MMPQGDCAIAFSTHWQDSARSIPASSMPYAAAAAVATATSCGRGTDAFVHRQFGRDVDLSALFHTLGIAAAKQVEDAQYVCGPADRRGGADQVTHRGLGFEGCQRKPRALLPTVRRHLRIDEYDGIVVAKLHCGPGGFADGAFEYPASGVIGVAAHQVEAAGRTPDVDGAAITKEAALLTHRGDSGEEGHEMHSSMAEQT
jgi:hypothetical protein